MLAAETKPVIGSEPWPRAAAVDPNGVAWIEISQPVAPFLAEVRSFLEAQVDTFEPEVAEGARYALSASGKQLRPVLVGLSAQAAGGITADHVVGAAIVELVHLATLIHDDVIDEAGVRRKIPTVAAKFGNQTAVLLGDCLFAHALHLAAGFPTSEICRVVATATKAVCSGEILQTLRRSRLDQSLADYFRIIELKTAELFSLACELGALLAAEQPAPRAALRQFGLAFGTAYQVFDDCLDLFGKEEHAGKTLGTDLTKGKITLPLLLAHEGASPADRLGLAAILARAPAQRLADLQPVLDRYRAGARSREVVESFLQTAREAASQFSGTPALLRLTDYLALQTSRLGTS